jgi:hypothetical protein
MTSACRPRPRPVAAQGGHRGPDHESSRDHRTRLREQPEGRRRGRCARRRADERPTPSRAAAPYSEPVKPGDRRQEDRDGSANATTRTKHELANCALADAERGRGVIARASLHAHRDEGLLLGVGKGGDRGEDRSGAYRLFDVLHRRAASRERFGYLNTALTPLAQNLQRRAMRDREQPGAQVAHLAASAERAPGVDKRLLHRVLGIISRETAAVAQQHRPIALDDRLKGGVIPRPGESDQTSVRPFPIERLHRGRVERQSAIGQRLTASV